MVFSIKGLDKPVIQNKYLKMKTGQNQGIRYIIRNEVITWFKLTLKQKICKIKKLLKNLKKMMNSHFSVLIMIGAVLSNKQNISQVAPVF
jgi:hypothetical protein